MHARRRFFDLSFACPAHGAKEPRLHLLDERAADLMRAGWLKKVDGVYNKGWLLENRGADFFQLRL